jgi:predicted Zn finger-like uncharacterized protein
MSMVTRCPQCNTTFRVTAAHLKAREGYVRCGRCSEVFNALATLAAMTDSEIAELPRYPLVAPSIEDARETAFLVPAESKDDSLLWQVLTGIAAVALVLQLISFFSAGIASRFPAIAPVMGALCVVLRCSLEVPSDPQDLDIADSDLRADSGRAGVVLLSVTLRNAGDERKAYPALEITLTDAQNRTVARKVLLPREYLKQKTARIAPRSEIPVEIALGIGDLDAAGYRLYLFYP